LVGISRISPEDGIIRKHRVRLIPFDDLAELQPFKIGQFLPAILYIPKLCGKYGG
jgi:hypothetical protein